MTLFWLGFCVGVLACGFLAGLVVVLGLVLATRAVRTVDPSRRPSTGVAPPVTR